MEVLEKCGRDWINILGRLASLSSLGRLFNSVFSTEVVQDVPGGKVNILGGHGIRNSKKKSLYEHVSYSERFTIFGAQYFPSFLLLSNHKSQLTLHTESHASDIGALRREGSKILPAKYRERFGIGHMFI
jgi:hypothetical protein